MPADGSIIIGARDFSPDSWGAGHLLPNRWLFALPLLYRKRYPHCVWTISGFAGRYPRLRRGRYLCAAHTNDEAPKPFRFRGFIYPGSYLLSRDLSSDYHRRADVSLPGSEWDRVGPSGYDHQASALLCTPGSSLLRTSHFVLRTSVCLAVICACGLCAITCWLPVVCWRQAGIRVACFVRFL